MGFWSIALKHEMGWIKLYLNGGLRSRSF